MSHRPRPSVVPFLLLGLMTVLAFGGPFAIVLAIRGGRRPDWPPDRPLEWWTFGIVTGLFVILMTACLAIGLTQWRRAMAGRPSLESHGERANALKPTSVVTSYR